MNKHIATAFNAKALRGILPECHHVITDNWADYSKDEPSDDTTVEFMFTLEQAETAYSEARGSEYENASATLIGATLKADGARVFHTRRELLAMTFIGFDVDGMEEIARGEA